MWAWINVFELPRRVVSHRPRHNKSTSEVGGVPIILHARVTPPIRERVFEINAIPGVVTGESNPYMVTPWGAP